MSENNRPDSEQKKDQTTAEDILAQVDSILADLENSAVAQLFAAPEKPKPEENKKPPEKEESAPPGEPEPPDKNAEQPEADTSHQSESESPEAETPPEEAAAAEPAKPSDESDAAEESPEDAEDEFDEEDSPDETEDEGDWDEPEFDDEGIEDELPEEEQSEEAEFEPIIEEKPDRLQKLKEKLKNHEKDKAEKKEQAKSAPKEKPKPKDEKKPEEKKPEPSVIEAPEDADDTTGMNFVQKAQYRAKMRRREQTRLRRENARRIQEGAEVTYQPMTRLDMQSVGARLAAAAIVLVAGIAMGDSSAALPLCLLAFLITALPIAARVLTNLTHGSFFDEYLLVLIASIGASALGSRAEATIVLILFEIGKIAGDIVLASTYQALPQQHDFMPEKATVVNMKGEQRQVPLADIRLGELVLVHSGERVPIDGVVLRGDGTVDDSVLTGENVPMAVDKNTRVLAGSRYNGSLMLIRVISRYEDCAVRQIRRVQNVAAEHKAALENSAQRNAKRLVPVVIVIAVLAAALPPLFMPGSDITGWGYRGLTLLIACCPTALALAVPLAFVCGGGRLESEGVHMKGSEAMERTADLRLVVFNKTGTVTTGNLQVKKIYPTQEFSEKNCLALAAAAEQLSQHPVARAIVSACREKLPKIEEFEEFQGRGVRARIGDHVLLVGNRKLMVSRGVKGLPDIDGTVVYIACEGEHIGVIELEDTVRPSAADAIKKIKDQGVERTVLITGDAETPTQRIANAAGIDTVHCSLMPEEKQAKLDFMMRTIPTDGTTAYVGDGVSDIEQLKMADVGVVMGTRGSRYSADAANVLITANDLSGLGEAVQVCKSTHGVAMQNLTLLAAIKLVLAVLALIGLAQMWMAVIVDAVLTVLTVFNTSRLLGSKPEISEE
ncbi:heavy metal translocating P-type ATPase [Agathobaculum sp.]|uniref:heavy metal translocating P-type ATPase n=1 Tax=Agathobaculum sp. TaxID=2048138 RepID=UPI003AB6FD58